MPPIASVSPSLTTTCVMAVRLLMLGMGPAAELMSSPLELFSTLTIILTRVMSPASRMTVGVTSSLSRARSEEHTSELQSRPHLVCRLLLEKKKRARRKHAMMLVHELHYVIGTCAA